MRRMSLMLRAVASLKNAALELYHISPGCSQGHHRLWQQQLRRHKLYPLECAVQDHTLTSLYTSLGKIEIPQSDFHCGCRNFDSHLPQQLQVMLCRNVMELGQGNTY